MPTNLNIKKAILLKAEYILSFFVLPFSIYLDLLPMPKFSILIILSSFTLFFVSFNTDIHKTRYLSFHVSSNQLKILFLRFIIFTPIIIVLTLILTPDFFFKLFLEQPLKWGYTAVMYLFFSVIPQEIMYRAFFFRRYRYIFRNQKVMIFFNALAFSFLHIIYNNIIAVIFTFAGGYLFASTYKKTGSILITVIEHFIYGYFVFTAGLGQIYFI